MSDVVIKVENLSKQYRLGTVGTGTISHDLNRAWAKLRGKEDPYLQIGQTNDRTKKGDSDYVWALKDINFEVKRGEVLGIIGRNGAGKSTLLKILSQITRPTTGSVKMKGRVGSLLEVGTGFHPELTGRENIYINGAILGMRKWEIDKKLDEIIDFAGVERYIDTPVKRYSSGMMVRLGFSVAAHLEPEILIVDEVLAVGDTEFQNKAINKMRNITSNGGRTVIFVSHDLSRVEMLSTQCLLMGTGEILKDGDIVTVLDEYYKKSFKIGQHEAPKGASGNYIKYAKLRKDKFQVNGELKLDIIIRVENALKDLSFAAQIVNHKENNLFHFLVMHSETELNAKDNEINLTLTIPKLNLYPGSYKFNFYLGDNAHKVSFDRVFNECAFEVYLPEALYRDSYWYADQAVSTMVHRWEVGR